MYTFINEHISILWVGILHNIMAKMLDCGLEVREFELQPSYYIHFRTNTLRKRWNPLIYPPPSSGLNSITVVFVQG